MRFAVISDIHSNLEALTRAFEIIDSNGIHEICCLGDIVGYGANPNECVELVFQRSSIILLGNHDLAAVDLSEAGSFTEHARMSAQWTSAKLTPGNKERLQRLPYTATFSGSFLVHSSPYEPGEWNYILSMLDARQAFRHFSERLCFVGHSHVPGIFGETSARTTVSRDERFLVNVGSVGQPRDRDARLSFGIFDSEQWEYQNIRSEYDVKTASRKIIASGLPRMLGERILHGV
jgi:diadenosine tetraphosphatase ApaH/serine/threonine PP2A family protein phosphatase